MELNTLWSKKTKPEPLRGSGIGGNHLHRSLRNVLNGRCSQLRLWGSWAERFFWFAGWHSEHSLLVPLVNIQVLNREVCPTTRKGRKVAIYILRSTPVPTWGPEGISTFQKKGHLFVILKQKASNTATSTVGTESVFPLGVCTYTIPAPLWWDLRGTRLEEPLGGQACKRQVRLCPGSDLHAHVTGFCSLCSTFLVSSRWS